MAILENTQTFIGDVLDLSEATLNAIEPYSSTALLATRVFLEVADFAFSRDHEETQREYSEDQHVGKPTGVSPLEDVSLDLNLLNYSEESETAADYHQAA